MSMNAPIVTEVAVSTVSTPSARGDVHADLASSCSTTVSHVKVREMRYPRMHSNPLYRHYSINATVLSNQSVQKALYVEKCCM